jgi:hypothetical protein
VKKRLGRHRLETVEGEVIEFGLQAESVKVKVAEFDARAGAQFELLDDGLAKPFFGEPGLKYQKHRDGDRGKRDNQNREETQPFVLHEPPSFETISILSRPRLSSSHLSARSLMARWMSTSRIVSSTSSSAGTSALRAFSWGTKSLR